MYVTYTVVGLSHHIATCVFFALTFTVCGSPYFHGTSLL